MFYLQIINNTGVAGVCVQYYRAMYIYSVTNVIQHITNVTTILQMWIECIYHNFSIIEGLYTPEGWNVARK